jgi:hypothetical protein
VCPGDVLGDIEHAHVRSLESKALHDPISGKAVAFLDDAIAERQAVVDRDFGRLTALATQHNDLRATVDYEDTRTGWVGANGSQHFAGDGCAEARLVTAGIT